VTSEQTRTQRPDPGQDSRRSRQAGFLGAVLIGAAAVIAAGLGFAPQVSAYSGLSPWVVAGLLGFLLTLAGACLLLAVSLAAPSAAAIEPAPYPEQSSAPPRASGGTTRALTVLGSLLGLTGVALAALAVALAVVLPAATAAIEVQFTDLYGRVQLEYCPSLPSSFAATASHEDLAGSDTILPVRVSGDVCGNTEYTDGVWLYLNRTTITVSDQP
jgi:hypothetical protein